eukprot:6762934-Karenia_brevis.AAC.1
MICKITCLNGGDVCCVLRAMEKPFVVLKMYGRIQQNADMYRALCANFAKFPSAMNVGDWLSMIVKFGKHWPMTTLTDTCTASS